MPITIDAILEEAQLPLQRVSESKPVTPAMGFLKKNATYLIAGTAVVAVGGYLYWRSQKGSAPVASTTGSVSNRPMSLSEAGII